jgi:hypothetical protein
MSMNWETFALEINAWFRLQAGWLSGENAYCNKSESINMQEVKISKLSAMTGTRASVIRIGDESAIVAEYRTITKYDSLNNNAANEGVLVYEVSGNIPTDEAPVKIIRKSAMLVDRQLSAAALKVGELIEHKGLVIALIEMNKEDATLLVGKSSDLASIQSRLLELKAAAALKAKQEAEAKAAAELKAKQDAEAKAITEAAAQKVIQDDFNAVTSSYQKLLLRIYNLKIKFPRVSNLSGIEEKLLRLPIILGSDLSTAKYNIQSVNASLDTSEKVWEKTQKTTITCVKGKLIKKVTSVKPKCPSGYKLKK